MCLSVSLGLPDACAASRALDAWIGKEGLDGSALQGQEKLCIEQSGAAREIEEVVDSEDEDEESSDEELTQSRSSSRR
jgi:hypothetical protein